MRPISFPSSDMKIVHYPVLESTNLTAAAAAKEGCEALYTVVADRQTAGRGRLDRKFFSPPSGLYFSTVLRPGFPAEKYGLVTPFAAVAVHRALKKVCHVHAKIKWVNDLLYNGKKICGILSVSGTDLSGKPYIVVGIGINTGDAAFPAELEGIAGHVPCKDRGALLRAVLEELAGCDAALDGGGWLTEYRENTAFIGERVTFSDGKNTGEAICLGVSETGALRLLSKDGTVAEYAFGEISVKPAQKN